MWVITWGKPEFNKLYLCFYFKSSIPELKTVVTYYDLRDPDFRRTSYYNVLASTSAVDVKIGSMMLLFTKLLINSIMNLFQSEYIGKDTIKSVKTICQFGFPFDWVITHCFPVKLASFTFMAFLPQLLYILVHVLLHMLPSQASNSVLLHVARFFKKSNCPKNLIHFITLFTHEWLVAYSLKTFRK